MTAPIIGSLLVVLINGAMADPPKPNIVYLMADDQNVSSVGAYGNPEVLTPQMDKLAADGVIFDPAPVRDKASYKFTVTTEANYRAVCNGVLQSRTTRSSRETWVYEQAEPMPAYLATVQIGRYGLLELDAGRSLAQVPQSVAATQASLITSWRESTAAQASWGGQSELTAQPSRQTRV